MAINPAETEAFIRDQFRRYPKATVQDIYKGLFQSTFGPGHMIKDEAAALSYLRVELGNCDSAADGFGGTVLSRFMEPLDGDFVRVHLGFLKAGRMTPEELIRLFVRSAEMAEGSVEDFAARIGILLKMHPEAADFCAEMAAQGWPACHHSAIFRDEYRPAYRVIHKSLIQWDQSEVQNENHGD